MQLCVLLSYCAEGCSHCLKMYTSGQQAGVWFLLQELSVGTDEGGKWEDIENLTPHLQSTEAYSDLGALLEK